MIQFFVEGQPVPKGNMKAFTVPGRRFSTLVDVTKGLKPWTKAVWAAALKAKPECAPWDGPVSLSLVFFLKKPKNLPKRRASWHVKKPDLDKLCRAVKDGLTGVIYDDDSQVVRLSAAKHYGDETGVMVCLEREDSVPAIPKQTKKRRKPT